MAHFYLFLEMGEIRKSIEKASTTFINIYKRALLDVCEKKRERPCLPLLSIGW